MGIAIRPPRWLPVRRLVGDRITPVLVIAGASAGAGITESIVLALVAQVAAAMVVGDDRVTVGLGAASADLAMLSAFAVALALALVRLGLYVVIGWLPARLAAEVQARLRRQLYAAYSASSWSLQSERADGYLQEMMSNQVTRSTQAVLQLSLFLSSSAMFLALVVSAFALSVPVALVVFASTLGLFALVRPLTLWGRASSRALLAADIRHATAVSEAVAMSEEAQVFGTAAAHRRRIESVIDEGRSAQFGMQLASRLTQAAYQGLVPVLIIGGLAGLYLSGAGELAQLGAAVLMLVRAATHGQQAQTSYHHVDHVIPVLEHMEAMTRECRSTTPPDGGRALPAICTLGLRHAGFAYDRDRPVLRDVSFTVTAGAAVGVMGPSGAGKSTLVQILLRLREPDTGAYLVNGEPAASFARADWQRRVAYVAQEPRIMHATVAENIRYFRDLDDDAVRRAARLAHIDHDIATWADGYGTVIGQRADAVSGGQRQRICLARALAGSPDLLVLDEPTSALDLASEEAIQASLADLLGRVTLFVVAHRPSLLTMCDQVLHVEHGRIRPVVPPGRAPSRGGRRPAAVTLTPRGPSNR